MNRIKLVRHSIELKNLNTGRSAIVDLYSDGLYRWPWLNYCSLGELVDTILPPKQKVDWFKDTLEPTDYKIVDSDYTGYVQ